MKRLHSLLLKVLELIFGYLLGVVQPILDSVYDFDDVHNASFQLGQSHLLDKMCKSDGIYDSETQLLNQSDKFRG